jgi:Leucine-rich repeat (LRR) protein
VDVGDAAVLGDSLEISDLSLVASEPTPAEQEADLADNAAVAINKANFPDAKFRAYVKKEFDTDGNGKLSKSEADAVTSIDVYDMGITSLKGVERFVNLVFLSCISNKMKTLDISKNRKLESLACSFNELTKLDLSKNTKLTFILCGNNKLKTLNFSKCKLLEFLDCSNNRLTKLTLGSKKYLTSLYAYDNKLKSIDFKNCPILKKLAKVGSTSTIGDTVWFEDGDHHYMAIDDTTRLTDGTKVLYKGA